MKSRLPVLLLMLLVPVLHAQSTKQRITRDMLDQHSPPDAVERAIAASLEDLLDDAKSFFEGAGPRSVRAILRSPTAEGKVASGTMSRSQLAAATVKLQEQASATLADLSTVLRGAQERMSRPPSTMKPDTRRNYEQMILEAKELSAAVSSYANHFKQATRGEIGKWISYDLPPAPDPRGRTGKTQTETKSGSKGQTISGYLVY